jgi:hypothetical protein
MELKFLILLFPVVFMFHDFEEIIFFKTWLTKNKDLLKSRFPRLSDRVLPHLQKLSTAGFSVAVAEEFILLSIITYTSIWWQNYFLWFAIFMAFSIHLIGHVIQWIIFRKYVPSIVTSLISLPYCVYTIYSFLSASTMSVLQVVAWTMIGLVIMLLNLILAHKLAIRFEKWKSL